MHFSFHQGIVENVPNVQKYAASCCEQRKFIVSHCDGFFLTCLHKTIITETSYYLSSKLFVIVFVIAETDDDSSGYKIQLSQMHV